MKKYIFIILLLFTSILFSEEKIKVAVLPFSSVNDKEGDTVSSIFANELSKRKVYTVLTRNSQMDKVMKELHFQRNGMTDDNTIAEIGKALNAEYVMAGSISKLGRNNVLVVSMINVETLENLTGDSRSFRNIEDVIQYVPQIVNEITGTKGNLKYSETVTDTKKSRRVIPGSGSQEAIDRVLKKREGQPGIKEIKSLIIRGLNTPLGKDTYIKDYSKVTAAYTPLMLATELKYNDLLEALIAAGADINDENILLTAIACDNIEGAAILIDSGVDINISSSSRSPIVYAASYDRLEIVKLLVEAGADIDSVDNKYTALMYAIEKENYDMVKYLLEHKADPNYSIKDRYTKTAMTVLSNKWRGYDSDRLLNILKILLEYGADPDDRGYSGNTILINILLKTNSVSLYDLKAVKLLIMSGADPNIENNNRKTALQLFESKNISGDNADQIIKMLLDAGAK